MTFQVLAFPTKPMLLLDFVISPNSQLSRFLLIRMRFSCTGASLVAQLVKNPPAMRDTWIRSLDWEDSPGEGKGYPLQYSGLENSKDCIVHGVQRVRGD